MESILENLQKKWEWMLQAFNVYVKEHPEIDRQIENSAAEYAKQNDNFVIDARLGWYAVRRKSSSDCRSNNKQQCKKLNKTFDYIIPTTFRRKIKIGSRSFVPFGNKKTRRRICCRNKRKVRNIKVKRNAKVQDKVYLTKKIKLAKWMANRYFCNISDCIKLMLPPGKQLKF